MATEKPYVPSSAQAGPVYITVDRAFFIVMKNDNQFGAAAFGLGTGQPWATTPSSYASL